ncbi:MAG: hypothetical protein WAR37_00160 [Candidatus Microsaccharimonas sp.]
MSNVLPPLPTQESYAKSSLALRGTFVESQLEILRTKPHYAQFTADAAAHGIEILEGSERARYVRHNSEPVRVFQRGAIAGFLLLRGLHGNLIDPNTILSEIISDEYRQTEPWSISRQAVLRRIAMEGFNMIGPSAGATIDTLIGEETKNRELEYYFKRGCGLVALNAVLIHTQAQLLDRAQANASFMNEANPLDQSVLSIENILQRSNEGVADWDISEIINTPPPSEQH